MKSARIVVLILAGCASAPPVESPAQFVHRTSSPILCYLHYAGNTDERALVAAELSARTFHCSERDVRDGFDHLRQMQAEQAQMAAQRSQERSAWFDRVLGVGLGAAAGYASSAPSAPPRPIVCQTTPNRLTTICN